MSNTTFVTAAAGVQAPDPRKHVNFTQGMVLGVDDFTQEFAYLSNRDEWLARDAIGYGTISGLKVALGVADDGDTQLSVSGGVALSPRGQLIRVGAPQCARLGAWLRLESTREKIDDLHLTAAGSITASLVLGYRACAVDDLPIPGEPCRCDSETMAPSRIMDDFWLELSLTPPPQSEEGAVRSFVAWLRAIDLVDTAPAGGLDAFLNAIRTAAEGAGSPPEFLHGSPPAGLQIPRSHLDQWMRAAFRLWVTELRPKWQAEFAGRAATAGDCDCDCHGTGDDLPDDGREGILLAEVTLTRTGAVLTDASLDESNRPFLLHLRMLQEMMLGNEATVPTLAGDVTGPAEGNTLSAIQHWPVDLSAGLANGTALGFDGARWRPVPIPGPASSLPQPETFGATGSMGSSPLYALADHVHPMPPAPTVPQPATALPAAETFGATGTKGSSPLYALADHVHPMPPAPAMPQPATALPAAETFGATGTKGSSPLYALADHVHPMPPAPAMPQPATAPPAAETFGAAGTKGTSSLYALADHVHPMPPDPVVPHNVLATTHRNLQLGDPAQPTLSDILGTATSSKVVGVRGIPIAVPPAPAQAEGRVMVFRSGQMAWEAQAATTAPTNMVEHPPVAGRYMIVAAGIIKLTASKPATIAAASSYNKLRLVPATTQPNSGGDFFITYGDVAAAAQVSLKYVKPGDHQYVVKGTTIGEGPGVLHVVGDQPDDGIHIRVIPTTTKLPAQVSIEISAFGKVQ